MEVDLPQTAKKAPISGVKSRITWRPLFIIVIALALIGTLFVFRDSLLNLIPSEKTTIEYFKLDKVEFSETRVKDLTFQKLNETLSSKNKNDAETSLRQAYFILLSEYDLRPMTPTRESITLVRDYTSQNFPDLQDVLSREIPCKQFECGFKPELSDDISELKDKVFVSKAIPDGVKDVLRVNFDDYAAASSKNDKNRQYFHLASIFANLNSSLTSENEAEVTGYLNQILDNLEKIDPEKFREEDEKGFFKPND